MRVLAFMVWMLAFAWSASAQDKVLNVYNWTDYIDPAALAAFTAVE